MNETLKKKKEKKAIIESKTLTDLWANLRKPRKPPASRKTQWHTTSQKQIMDDENIFKNKN